MHAFHFLFRNCSFSYHNPSSLNTESLRQAVPNLSRPKYMCFVACSNYWMMDHSCFHIKHQKVKIAHFISRMRVQPAVTYNGTNLWHSGEGRKTSLLIGTLGFSTSCTIQGLSDLRPSRSILFAFVSSLQTKWIDKLSSSKGSIL